MDKNKKFLDYVFVWIKEIKINKVKRMGLINWMKETWAKTVFPEKIRRWKEKKRLAKQHKYEEQQYITKIKHEAKIEAMQDAKGMLKEKYKKQFVNNLANPKPQKSGMQKFADAMKIDTGKMNEKLGQGGGFGSGGFGNMKQTGGKLPSGKGLAMGGGIDTQSKIDKILGKQTTTHKYKKENITLIPKSKTSYEDKVKKYLGR